MEKQKIDMFVFTNKKFFTPLQMKAIEETLKTLPDDKAMSLLIKPRFRNPSSMLTIAIFLGIFGVDRFMLGDVGWGIGKIIAPIMLSIILGLIFGGIINFLPICAFMLSIIDSFTVRKRTCDYNFKKINEMMMY